MFMHDHTWMGALKIETPTWTICFYFLRVSRANWKAWWSLRIFPSKKSLKKEIEVCSYRSSTSLSFSKDLKKQCCWMERWFFFPRKTTTMFSSRKTVLIHNFSTARHLHKECHCKKSHIIPETLFLTNRKDRSFHFSQESEGNKKPYWNP